MGDRPEQPGRPRGVLAQRHALQGQSKYRRIRDINSGSYGQVQLAVDSTTNEQVAIKLMERGSKITKYVERELINHSHLLHPHIVQVRRLFCLPGTSRELLCTCCALRLCAPLLAIVTKVAVINLRCRYNVVNQQFLSDFALASAPSDVS